MLSALHGLLDLDLVIRPYERWLGGKKEREVWGRRVSDLLIARHGREVDYLVLAGADYAGPLATGLRTHDGHRGGAWRGVAADRILRPLVGLTIGQRLRLLSDAARGAV